MKEFLQTYKKQIIVGALVLLALLSFFVIADSVWIKDLNKGLVRALDIKKTTVASLAATAVATSTSITLIPGDIGTPIAENLANMTNYLVIIFGAIWLQKYLVGIASFLFFKLLLPISCLLFAGNVFWKNESIRKFAIRIFLFGGLFFILLPTSVAVSQHIEKSYESSVEQTIKEAEKDNSSIQKKAEEDQDLWSKVTSFVSDAYQGTMDKVQKTMSNLLDAVAVLIVTTCVIPILVFFIFAWMVKLIFGLNYQIKVPRLGRKHRKMISDKSQS